MTKTLVWCHKYHPKVYSWQMQRTLMWGHKWHLNSIHDKWWELRCEGISGIWRSIHDSWRELQCDAINGTNIYSRYKVRTSLWGHKWQPNVYSRQMMRTFVWGYMWHPKDYFQYENAFGGVKPLVVAKSLFTTWFQNSRGSPKGQAKHLD